MYINLKDKIKVTKICLSTGFSSIPLTFLREWGFFNQQKKSQLVQKESCVWLYRYELQCIIIEIGLIVPSIDLKGHSIGIRISRQLSLNSNMLYCSTTLRYISKSKKYDLLVWFSYFRQRLILKAGNFKHESVLPL